MFKKREVPTYIITGFLESGKTSFVIETMREGQFADGNSTAYFLCEEGIEEIDTELLEKNRFKIYPVESEADITKEFFLSVERKDHPDRVMIEYNGMWDQDTLLEALPDQWLLAEAIATVDAGTYETYLNNMKMMILNQFAYSDLILFNRCKEGQDLAMYKRTAHAKNRRAQVIFEMEDGTMRNDIKEELPYDINAPVISIEDDDFGLWYLDVYDNLQNYMGKTVRFKGQVYKPRRGKADYFVPGRFAMTCCAADIQFVGFPCRFDRSSKLKDKAYVMVTAVIQASKNPNNNQPAPYLIAKTVEKAEPAEEEVVYFT